MSAIVQEVFYYPAKGFTGARLNEARLGPGGIPNDRALAFAFVETLASESKDVSAERFPWANKIKLASQMNWPGLAALRMDLQATGERMILLAPSGERHVCDLRSQDDRARISAFVSNYLETLQPAPGAKIPASRRVVLVGQLEAGTRYPDRQKEHVSILSLATLRDIAMRMGKAVDIRRFRGNLVLDGLEAWAEAGWVGKRLQIGGAELEATQLIGRCFYINVHPEKGIADVDLLGVLRHRTPEVIPAKNAIFGIMARVTSPGPIRQGDAVQLKS